MDSRTESKVFEGPVVTGLKAVVLNHPKKGENRFSIVTYGQSSTSYRGYETAAEFLLALKEKIFQGG